MVTKLLSLSAAITTVDLAIRGRMDPGAPVYYFASNRIWVNILIISVVALSVAISFKAKSSFKNWYVYAAIAGLTTLMVLIGGLGVFYGNFRLDGWDLLLPLDYLMLLESGVVLAIACLSYTHPKRPQAVADFAGRAAATAKAPVLAAAEGMKVAYLSVKDAVEEPSHPQRRLRA